MHRTLAIALFGLCLQAAATPSMDELGAKARNAGTGLDRLLQEHPGLGAGLPAWGDPAGDAAWYRQIKEAGLSAPAELLDRLFPDRGRDGGNGARDGGDGPGDATPIGNAAWGASFTDTGTTADKTDQLGSGVPLPALCYFNSFLNTFGAADAWYSFTLEEPTWVEVNTCLETTLYDTALGLFDADLDPVSVDDDLDGCPWIFRSYLECCLAPGDYFIVVDGYDVNQTGDYEIEVAFAECPPDPCDAYGELVVALDAPTTFTGDNTDFPHLLGDVGGDAGFELTFAEPGIWSFRSCDAGTVADVDLHLFDASPCDGGQLVAENTVGGCVDGGNAGAANLERVPLDAGSYHLTVGSGLTEGAFLVEIFSPCEAYEAAVQTATAPATLTGSTVGEPNIQGDGGGEAGWEIAIPTDGFWDFDACMPGTAFDADLALRAASPCAGGELLAASTYSICEFTDGAARLREIPLEAGVYHLTVGAEWTLEGDYEILVQETPARPVEGGPDEMGYTWINSWHAAGPAFEWVEIAGVGQALALSDDSSVGPLELGFAFPFYEDSWTEVFVGSNGFLSFGAGSGSLSNQDLPDPTAPNDLIALFWDDLNPASGGTVYAWSDPDEERFVVQYDHVRAYGSTAEYTFQAILRPSGDVTAQYLDMAETDVEQASAGLENGDGAIGLGCNFNGEGGTFADGTAVLYRALEGDFQAPTIQFDLLPESVETELPGDHAVVATITDATGVAEATVFYRVNGGALQSAAMANEDGDVWSGGIPHQDAGASVTAHIEAVDATEAGNLRVSPDFSFDVVSYHWPPTALVASDGALSETQVDWLPPVDPEVLAEWFGGDVPPDPSAGRARLQERHGLDSEAAAALWRQLFDSPVRRFLEYKVYRDGALVATTTDTHWTDSAGEGSELDVIYDYHVAADYDAGESDPSNVDAGYWGSPPTWGGPDAFGYTFVSSEHPAGPAYEWVDISGIGQAWDLQLDDFEGPLELGFQFPFYGSFFDECYVCSNGYVSFGQGYTTYISEPLPQPGNGWAPDNIVAPFWDDFNLPTGGTVYTWADPENERFIAQWDGALGWMGGGPHTFQARLHSSGIVEVAYEDLDEADVSFASVGLENADGTIGLQVNFRGEGALLADQVQVTFVPPSDCGPVDCAGQAESEPNQGWEDGNASCEVIRCGETWCGALEVVDGSVDADWYRYTHFGGDIVFSLEASDFDARLRFVEHAVDGAVLAVSDVFPRCFDESLAVAGLASGTYYLVVEHDGAADLDGPQSYALTLECSGDPCAGHEPISCDGTAETEPNEGWNDGNESYGEIALGETVCGTVTAQGGQRDLDWFRFALDAPADLAVSVAVDAFDAAVFVTDFDPEGGVVATMDLAPPCHPEQLEVQALPAGEYFLVVGHNALDGVPEPQAYALSLTVVVPEEPMCDNWIDGGELVDWYSVSRPAPGLAHHSGAGCPGGVSSPGRDEVVRLVLPQAMDLQLTMHGEGDADEVILLVGDCASPANSCGAAADELGAGDESETLTALGLPAGDYFIVADFAGPGETHGYTLTAVDMNSGLDPERPLAFALEPNYPNPFNPVTTIRWTQPELLPARLTIHNLLGEVVARLELGFRGPGRQAFVWDASDLGSGVYVYTLSSGPHRATGKAVLLK